jgi:hypothetical protein
MDRPCLEFRLQAVRRFARPGRANAEIQTDSPSDFSARLGRHASAAFGCMARLIVKTQGLGLSTLELRLGVNRVGRDPKSDFPFRHFSVSTRHCELILSNDGVVLHDCGSTNGTCVNGQPVSEDIWLEPGQLVRLGDVELLVESTDASISIPAIQRDAPAPPPVVLEDGVLLCPRHADHFATFRCTHCHEVMCTSCVRMMRIKGGKPLFLCCICHHKCERIVAEKTAEKKGFLGFLQETVGLKFGHPHDGKKK